MERGGSGVFVGFGECRHKSLPLPQPTETGDEGPFHNPDKSVSFPVTIVPKSNLHPVWCVCTIKHLLPLPNVVCMPLHVTHTVDKCVKFSSHYSAQIKSSPSVVCVYHQAPVPFAQCCVYATPCHPHCG